MEIDDEGTTLLSILCIGSLSSAFFVEKEFSLHVTEKYVRDEKSFQVV